MRRVPRINSLSVTICFVHYRPKNVSKALEPIIFADDANVFISDQRVNTILPRQI